MARINGAKCRICRRLGTKLFLKGTRCDTPKCPIEKDNKPPGVHGAKRIRLTEYGIHLREVQRAKKMYGMMQRQFRRYYDKAIRLPGNTGGTLAATSRLLTRAGANVTGAAVVLELAALGGRDLLEPLPVSSLYTG